MRHGSGRRRVDQGHGHLATLSARRGIASPDGHCRAFDARAQGTLFGDGVGIVVLKRIAEALEDRDHIYGVIRGSAINNDGASKVGYTAPSVSGQARVIGEALSMAGVEAETIGHVEAHGTGTALGDPVEIAALSQAFRATTDKTGFCAISSVKTNIGHLDAAAGMASLDQDRALMLHYRMLPRVSISSSPTLKSISPAVRFFVNTRLREWNTGESPRRAGVSSWYGAHSTSISSSKAPAVRRTPAFDRPLRRPRAFAKTDSALLALADASAQYLRRASRMRRWRRCCFTANVGRMHFPHRLRGGCLNP